ncbi:MAG: DJ-1/PfpI family protein [Cytophagales bacterium]
MKITFFLYEGCTAIDIVGTNEILSRLPNVEVRFAAQWKGEIQTDTPFMKLFATHTLDEIHSTDVLIVPGATVSFLEILQNKKVLSWVKGLHPKAKYVCSVSSGSIILAAAGLLEGKKATSHWYSLRFLADYGVKIVQERYIKDDKIITSAGSTACLDMALYLAELLAGTETAKALQLMLEYDAVPPFSSGHLAKASKETMVAAKKKLKEEALRSGILTLI